MKCFQLIKTVLDEAHAAIPGSMAERDEAIRVESKALTAKYKKLTTEGCLDYSNPACRFAYILKYTTSHANIVCERIINSTQLRNLFNKDKVLASCIGGGPGSDFLGIMKFCETR